MFVAQQANAQLKFGVKGGLNVSKISFSEDVFDGSNRGGWFIGPTVKFSLPIVGLGIDASALYDQRSSKVENTEVESGETTIKQQSIVIPINARYGFGVGDLANIFFFAGPQFGFNVGDDEFSWTSANSYKNTFQLKKSNFSVNLGLGATLFSHLQASVNYNIAVGKTGEATFSKTASEVSNAISKGRTNSWQIAVAYFF